MSLIISPDVDKALLGTLATVLTFVAFVPYLRAIHAGHTRPHVFSWVIWGLNTGIAFLAVLAARGGAGAWPIGVSCAVTLYVAGLAYIRRADVTTTRTDWLFFLAALASMPLWALAGDPLWAVVLITTIEVLGFGPTVRKCWVQPHSESLAFYAILIARNGLIVAALEHYALSTMLFPVAMAAACALLIALMLWRRPIVAVSNQ